MAGLNRAAQVIGHCPGIHTCPLIDHIRICTRAPAIPAFTKIVRPRGFGRLKTILRAALCALFILPPLSAPAADLTVVVGAGAAVSADYYDDEVEGVHLARHFSATLDFGGVRVKSKAGGLMVDFGRGDFKALGIIIRPGTGLDLSGSINPAKAALPVIDSGVEIGFSVARSLPGFAPQGYDLTAHAALYKNTGNGPHGLSLETGATLVRQIGANKLWVAVAARGGDATHRQAFFGVSAADALASGFAQTDLGAGIDDVGITLGYARPLTENLYLGASLQYSHLVGASLDSAKTARNAAYQIGFGVGYKF